MPIAEVHNIRDLLIAVVGEELEAARQDGRVRQRYVGLDPDEALVAWVLDAITIRSLKLLVKLRAEQGWPDE